MHPSAVAHRGLRAVEAAREAAGQAWTRSRDRGRASPDTVWTTLRGRSLLATPVGCLDGPAVVRVTADAVSDFLSRAGIAHATAQTQPPTIAVETASWAAVADALERLALYAQQGDALAPLHRFRARRGAVRVFRPWATVDGDYLAGPDLGVDLVFGPAPDPVPDLGDIDAVFTWVDGADPAWQERKRRRLEAMGQAPLHDAAANDARFVQIDELRYALLSIERFAPWIRRIHLVTDGQRPAWLAREFPHVRLVRHEEIFSDPTALPTFNSHAIESRLHHIPGLAERYLYFNDDFLLGRYTHPADYFAADGRPRVFLTGERIPDGVATLDDQPVVAAAKNNSAVLAGAAGARATHKLKHAPYATLRSVAFELEALAAERFAETQRSPFRARRTSRWRRRCSPTTRWRRAGPWRAGSATSTPTSPPMNSSGACLICWSTGTPTSSA